MPRKINQTAFLSVFFIAGLAIIGFIIVPDPFTYEGLPVRAQIVDSKTRDPIEGVVVVSWSKRGGFFHTFNAGTIAFQRTVTDTSGNFFVPGWPKVWRFPDSLLNGEFIDSEQPTVYMLKAGYKPWFGWSESPRNKEDKESRDKGKIEWYIQELLTLTRLSGTEEEMYYKFKRSFISVSNFIPDVTFCGDFDKFKLALLEVDKQEYRAERAGVDGRHLESWLSPQILAYRKPCANIAKWLKSQREKKKEFYEDF